MPVTSTSVTSVRERVRVRLGADSLHPGVHLARSVLELCAQRLDRLAVLHGH